jgi:hypothetical protein
MDDTRRLPCLLPIAAVFIFATVPWVRSSLAETPGVARAFGGHLRSLSAHSE